MALYLVQHGKSLSKDEDTECRLSPDGIVEAELIARQIRDFGVRVTVIKHSGKRRALDTAEIFADVLMPDQGFQEQSGINPLDDVVPFALTVNTEDNAMVIGHLPFLGRLVSHLITDSIDHPIVKFRNAGITCLDIDADSGGWIIKWIVNPSWA